MDEFAVGWAQALEAFSQREVAFLDCIRLEVEFGRNALEQVVVKNQPTFGGEATTVIEEVVADGLKCPGLEVGAEFVGVAFLPKGDVDLLQ